ncbi:MAG: ring-cleaving dioxygenase [Gemmatimonadota bacterium]
MTTTSGGLHHVTAIAGDPQRNLDFYTGTLGMRLVKKTVNFDDPTAYHFYFGDATGTPGSLLTFFPWGSAPRGRQGVGQAASVALAIPAGSLGWWIERLIAQGVAYEGPVHRFGEAVLTFRDPDGMAVELVATAAAGAVPGWDSGTLPAEHAIRGLHTTTLWVSELAPTAQVLTDALGFTRVGEHEGTVRFAPSGASHPIGAYLDVRPAGGFWSARMGVGSIHHVAFRVADDTVQDELRGRVLRQGLGASPRMDRNYFRSVYFREPNGVLFELATDGPGMLIDEPLEHLGESLRLPPQYEPMRAGIEAALPELALARGAHA